MEINTEGLKSHRDITGFNEPKPGKYHVMVQSVNPNYESDEKKTPGIQMEFQVLNGTVPGQEGCVHSEAFWTSGAAFTQNRLKRLALILDLIKPGQKKDVDFTEAMGRQLIIAIDLEEYKGKLRPKIPFMDFWALGDEEVADVPVNQEAIRKPPVVTATKEQPKEAAAAATGSASKWGDL